MKTTVTLFIFFTLFTVNTVAQDFTHTDFELEDEPVIGSVHSVTFSPDGKTLATAGSEIHLWDVETATHKNTFYHGSWVNSVAFSPDGKTLASTGYRDPKLHLWDVETGTHKATFDYGEWVSSVAFSPDGKTLVSTGYRDPKLHLWDVETGTHKATFDHGKRVISVAFSPDGKTLVSTGYEDPKLHLWDVETGTHKATFDLGKWVRSVAFSPDGKTLATGGWNLRSIPVVYLWDVETGIHKATFDHGSPVRSVAFSPDGKTLATGSGRYTYLRDIETGTHKATFDHGGSVYNVAFSPDGKTLVSTGYEDPKLHLWDVETGTHKATFDLGNPVRSVAFSPDGKTLATAGGNSIDLWNVETSRIKIRLPVRYRSFVHSIAFSPDGKTLASVGKEPRIHLWDVDTTTHKATLGIHEGSDSHRVAACVFSPDGKTLATANIVPLGTRNFITRYESRIHLWNVDTATHKHTFVYQYYVSSVAFSPDGKTFAIGGESRIHLWDVDTATHKTTLGTHGSSVHSIAFSPDGKTLATAGTGNIHLWDIDASRIKITLPVTYSDPGYRVVFSPDGKTFATAGRNSIHLWDVDTATHNATLGNGGSSCVAFSPDGKTLATAGGNSIHLWDVDAGTHKATLGTHGSSVNSIAFSPDGKTLASASDGAGVRLWKFPTTSVNVTPYPVVPPAIGEQFTVNLSIVEGENVGGYQFNIGFDKIILRYVDSANGDYLSPGSFFVPPVVSEDVVTLSATSLTGTSNGDGTLATVTFEVLDVKESPIALSDLILTDSAGKHLSVLTNSGRIEPTLSSSPAVIDLTPSSVLAPAIGEQLAFNIRISEGQNVAGYQVILEYDIKALKPVLAGNGLYLPDASPAKPLISQGVVTLGASSPTGVGNGDGVLATITFEVLTVQASTVSVSGYLTTPNGLRSTPTFKDAKVIVALLGDVNRDGTVNILDLVLVSSSFGKQVPEGGDPADVNEDGVINVVDLVIVAGAIGGEAAAPALHPQALAAFTASDVQQWLAQAQHTDMNDPISQRGIRFLEQLLAALIPKETALLVNYPNPFNPETWIPYQLAEPADVNLTIYAVDGTVVRTLALGHQPVGIYQDKSRAAYWDGRNEVGESVASGVYFYTLTAGDFTATLKMLIRK